MFEAVVIVLFYRQSTGSRGRSQAFVFGLELLEERSDTSVVMDESDLWLVQGEWSTSGLLAERRHCLDMCLRANLEVVGR